MCVCVCVCVRAFLLFWPFNLQWAMYSYLEKRTHQMVHDDDDGDADADDGVADADDADDDDGDAEYYD